MSQIAICGLGNFGTALARNWITAGHSVAAWTVEQDVYDSIQQTGINLKYLPDVDLQGLTVSMDLDETVRDAEYVILAIPSHVVIDVVEELANHLQPASVILDLAKGLGRTEQLISDEIQQVLMQHGHSNPVCVMMGPTIAPELARGVLTIALVACTDHEVAESTAKALTTQTLKLSSAQDPIGAEYWGAFKNVIALACGVADGLKVTNAGGDNLKAAIFTRGFAEAAELLPSLGACPTTAFTAAGIGDLFVTATSPHGRNRATGERLGRGETLDAAQNGAVMVSEGVRATEMFEQRFRRINLASPFVDAVSSLIKGQITAEQFAASVATVDPK